jgi:hypothetical protein
VCPSACLGPLSVVLIYSEKECIVTDNQDQAQTPTEPTAEPFRVHQREMVAHPGHYPQPAGYISIQWAEMHGLLQESIDPPCEICLVEKPEMTQKTKPSVPDPTRMDYPSDYWGVGRFIIQEWQGEHSSLLKEPQTVCAFHALAAGFVMGGEWLDEIDEQWNYSPLPPNDDVSKEFVYIAKDGEPFVLKPEFIPNGYSFAYGDVEPGVPIWEVTWWGKRSGLLDTSLVVHPIYANAIAETIALIERRYEIPLDAEAWPPQKFSVWKEYVAYVRAGCEYKGWPRNWDQYAVANGKETKAESSKRYYAEQALADANRAKAKAEAEAQAVKSEPVPVKPEDFTMS